jgi:hypothetical protein
LGPKLETITIYIILFIVKMLWQLLLVKNLYFSFFLTWKVMIITNITMRGSFMNGFHYIIIFWKLLKDKKFNICCHFVFFYVYSSYCIKCTNVGIRQINVGLNAMFFWSYLIWVYIPKIFKKSFRSPPFSFFLWNHIEFFTSFIIAENKMAVILNWK